ncbi:hypothetical protein [Pectobacterium brasiliense]|uniref:hypothetical protein n=1 Tax=Pectobacterium brasiliense TaxID=180957 RepID=UPI0019696CA5|nr:hypothetical protein [Pectobacterium brasiliense]MBN3262176.1 hypothetical protein [Pectobacterium brasiliense]
MTKNFHSLSELVAFSEGESDVIIQQWIDGKLPLYVHFDGRHPVCTFRRCISIDEHKCAISDIIYGRDLYQHSDSSEGKQRLFVPETPLDAHLKVTPEFRYGGMVYEYKYRGKAYGYWHIKPSNSARFCRGDFLITDVGLKDLKPDTLGDVTIHAQQERDYLIFSEPTYINRKSLFVDDKDVLDFIQVPEVNKDLSMPKAVRQKPAALHKAPSELVVLYILMQECSLDKSGVMRPSIVEKPLTSLFGVNFDIDTVKGYGIRPELEREKAFRVNKKQEMAISYLLIEFCNKNKIDKSPVSLCEELNSLSQSERYSLNFTFSESEIKNWLDIYPA